MKMTTTEISPERTVLPRKFSGGPKGLGDPEDRSLRKVEIEVVIPQKMREKARKEKCISEVHEFEKCCKDAGISMVYKCQPQNTELKACLIKWFQDDSFRKECTEEYLHERSEFRRTGIRKAAKRM